MAIACTIKLQTGTSSPGAASQATASLSVVAGNAYFVYLTAVKGTTDPAFATLTGAGQTWTEITAARNPWTATGTTRRATQMFYCVAASTTSGALTFAGLNTPDILDWQVVEVTGAHATTPYVASNIKLFTGSYTLNLLVENVTMNAAADTANRWLGFATANVNATTWRFELNADSGGDADWTQLGSFGSASSRARKNVSAWLNALPASDLTPGVFGDTSSGVYCQTMIELVVAAGAPASNIKSVAGNLIATVKSVDGLAVASVKSVAGLVK